MERFRALTAARAESAPPFPNPFPAAPPAPGKLRPAYRFVPDTQHQRYVLPMPPPGYGPRGSRTINPYSNVDPFNGYVPQMDRRAWAEAQSVVPLRER